MPDLMLGKVREAGIIPCLLPVVFQIFSAFKESTCWRPVPMCMLAEAQACRVGWEVRDESWQQWEGTARETSSEVGSSHPKTVDSPTFRSGLYHLMSKNEVSRQERVSKRGLY